MRNLLLILLVVIEAVILMSFKKEYKNEYKYNIDFYKATDIDRAKMENYVIGVVAAEMPATFSLEALKAQAVASRTFAYRKILDGALDFDNLESDKGQAYISQEDMKKNWNDKYNEYYNKISTAVLSTRDEVITHDNNVIKSYYFSLSNGKTEDSKTVFGEENYLVSVDSSWDKESNGYSKSVVLSSEDFKNKIGITGNIDITNIERSNTNHVDKITINGKTIDGIKFRKLYNLRSTDFDIKINDDNVIIETRGYGHGVGMSQYGANSMAKEGKNYKEILSYYYNDIEIKDI